LFSDDIDGTARGAAWDIVADEYVSVAAPAIPTLNITTDATAYLDNIFVQ
jgi:hypothetical protein